LTAYRQALARALDDLDVFILSAAAAGPPTTVTSLSLINTATGVTSSLFEGAWLFHSVGASAPQARRVAAYTPATGLLTLAAAMNAPSVSDTCELSRLFPAIAAIGSETDYRTIINRGLGRMMIERKDTISATVSDSYPLTAFPSLDRPERLRRVSEPNPHPGRATPVDSAHRKWRVVPDVPTAALENDAPFAVATGVVTLEWTAPATKWIAVAATWAESAVGLVNESDEAQPAIEEALPFLVEEALTVLIARAPGRPNAEWERKLEKARDDIAVSRYRDRTQVVEQAPVAEGRAA
jgi:hypothetical protein